VHKVVALELTETSTLQSEMHTPTKENAYKIFTSPPRTNSSRAKLKRVSTPSGSKEIRKEKEIKEKEFKEKENDNNNDNENNNKKNHEVLGLSQRTECEVIKPKQKIKWERNLNKNNREHETGGAPLSKIPLITEKEFLESMHLFNKGLDN